MLYCRATAPALLCPTSMQKQGEAKNAHLPMMAGAVPADDDMLAADFSVCDGQSVAL